MAETMVTTDTDAPSVIFTCGWCGRPVTLAPGPIGAEISDLASFLRAHAGCLRHAANAAEALGEEQ